MRDLAEKAKGGDLEAFGQLVERLQDAVYGTAYAILGNVHDAEDVAQEAFIQAWRDLSSLRSVDRFSGWLYRITRNRCVDFLRRPGRKTRPLDTASAAVGPAESDPARRLQRAEFRDAALSAIRSLSEPNRLATTLFYINGYRIEEVASFLAVPAGTVKRRLRDSRRQLKKRMIAMVEEHLQRQRPAADFRKEIMKRIGHWDRFDGSDEQKTRAVAEDPEWARLVARELQLEPMSAECRKIRRRIACLEACHEHYAENVEAVLAMIGRMQARPVLDCGQACAARRDDANACALALEAWQAGRPLPDDAMGRAGEVFQLLGERTDAKDSLVRHLIAKLRDNAYQVYADEEEDFEQTESRIQHLEICNYNWRENLRIVLREIAAGRRLFAWHVPDGYNAHGDCPDRVSLLRSTMTSAADWATGDVGTAGAWGEALGESTPEKRWLVASLCKHVAAQHASYDAGGALPRPSP